MHKGHKGLPSGKNQLVVPALKFGVKTSLKPKRERAAMMNVHNELFSFFIENKI